MAIDMVLVGSGDRNSVSSSSDLEVANAEKLSEVVSKLWTYVREMDHERMISGIGIGVSLIQYGQEESSDVVIKDMRLDRDPVMRYGSQYALEYCGTGYNKVVRILLHTAVYGVSDDVHMAAVIGLEFVLYKTPDRVPQMVRLLLEIGMHHV